jgi:hypothetical protein
MKNNGYFIYFLDTRSWEITFIIIIQEQKLCYIVLLHVEITP